MNLRKFWDEIKDQVDYIQGIYEDIGYERPVIWIESEENLAIEFRSELVLFPLDQEVVNINKYQVKLKDIKGTEYTVIFQRRESIMIDWVSYEDKEKNLFTD